MKLSFTDKCFFGSIVPYLVFGIADIYYGWFDPTFITMVWILFLAIIAFGWILIPRWRADLKHLKELREGLHDEAD